MITPKKSKLKLMIMCPLYIKKTWFNPSLPTSLGLCDAAAY